MNHLFFNLCASALGSALALQSPPTAAKTTEMVLHSFGNGTDGLGPLASLIDVRGTLYGTTNYGGAYDDNGTVFSLDPSTGTETVLHSFGGAADGTLPDANLINVKGTLYGTTQAGGGGADAGAVFSVDPSTGIEKVVYSFNGGTPGSRPSASLIDVKGTLYGTTLEGGAYDNNGTVFSLDPSTGAETVLHSFGGGTDGSGPLANLINVKATLYGTTESGGNYRNCKLVAGCGTVFSVKPNTGAETVVYSFCRRKNCTDGGYAVAGLIDVNGTLYGTTLEGGAYGDGTVFSITPSGKEKVLHSFGSGTDGDIPGAGLIDVNGTLYGTTEGGGGNTNCAIGCGTAFSITPSGKEKVLHSFGSGTDGEYPCASLIDVKGTLYGTTENGGVYGQGTVFALTP